MNIFTFCVADLQWYFAKKTKKDDYGFENGFTAEKKKDLQKNCVFNYNKIKINKSLHFSSVAVRCIWNRWNDVHFEYI